MRNKPVAKEYETSVVFAAACAAFRINGEYTKMNVEEYNTETNTSTVLKYANKFLVQKILDGEFQTTDADVEMAEKVMNFCRAVTFKLLKDRALSEFEHVMLSLVDKPTIHSRYDIAVAASLPAVAERAAERRDIDIRLRECSGGLIGSEGDKVELCVEVVKSNYSNQWNTWYITGITPEDNVVFFAYKLNIPVGSTVNIKGKVKKHKDGDRTQLSHVKVK